MKLSDKEARQKISYDISHNFFVEANAGSGKTTSLVNRMVSLVEAGVPVSEICTITFTKAAADEFFSRFQEVLSIRSLDKENDIDQFLGPKSDLTRKRCEQALSDIDLCFLGTMDSFTNLIANELPAEIDIPSNSILVSNEDRDKTAKDFFEIALADKHFKYHDKAVRFLHAIPQPYELFSAGISKLYSKRNTKIEYKKFNKSLAEELANERKLLNPLIDDFLNYISNPKDFSLRVQSIIQRFKAYKNMLKGNNWDNYVHTIVRLFKDLTKDTLKFSKKLTDDALAKYFELQSQSYVFNPIYKDMLVKIRDIAQDYQYFIYMDFVTNAILEVSNELKNSAKLTFFDYLYYVTEAIKKSATSDNRELVDYLFNKHKYFLIDESQDTNPMQTELFFYLASEKGDLNYRKCELRDGSIFIVGDPKQSIYAFREANVEAYQKNKEFFENKDEVLVLSNNYRSNYTLKKWFNDVMNDVLNCEFSGLTKDITHEDIPLDPNDKRQNLINKNPEILDGVFKYFVNENEKKQISNLINFLVDNDNYKIIAKKDKTPRKIEYKDFLIVPIRKEVEKLIKEFVSKNIPLVVEADLPFKESESLMFLKDMVCLLKNPSDTMNLIKVLGSSLFNFDDSDVLMMKQEGFSLDISSLLTAENEEVSFKNPRYQEIICLLNKLYLETKNMNFSSTLLYVLNSQELNLFKGINSAYLEYAYYLIEKVKEGENDSSITTFKDLEKYLDKFVNCETDENRVLRFEEEINRVKIANLHKVKGLQAPIVILARLTGQSSGVSCNVDFSSGEPITRLSSIKLSHGSEIKTNQFDDLIPLWEELDERENRRKEYVAATRAESVLIVAANGTSLLKNATNAWDHLVKNIEDSQDIFKILNIDDDYEAPIKESQKVNFDTLSFTSCVDESSNTSTYNIASPSEIRYKSHFEKEEKNLDSYSYDNLGAMDRNGREIGKFIHAYFEYMVSSNGHYDSNELVEYLIKVYDSKLNYKEKYLGIAEILSNKGYEQVNSELDQDIISTLLNAEQVMCEIPFSYMENNTLTYGIIDCIYKDKNGYHIIDYKTGKENDIKILENYKYKHQLESYKKAFKHITGLDADAHIYHVDTSVFDNEVDEDNLN